MAPWPCHLHPTRSRPTRADRHHGPAQGPPGETTQDLPEDRETSGGCDAGNIMLHLGDIYIYIAVYNYICTYDMFE